MSGLMSRMSVYTHFSFSSQLLPTPRAAHCESLGPPQRQQDTTCSRTCQSPFKHWLEWVVASETTRALVQILLHPAAKSTLPSKNSPSPSLPASLNGQEKATNAYNDVARKDFIYSTFSQSFLCCPISQNFLCTCLSSGCGGEGCHRDELWQDAGGYSLKGQTPCTAMEMTESIFYLPLISRHPRNYLCTNHCACRITLANICTDPV